MTYTWRTIIHFIGHYKYLIVIVLGLFLVGIADENSIAKRIQYSIEIGKLKEEIKKYDAQDKTASDQLDQLRRNPKYIEKIARERYFMKADDEDIFVLSTDIAPKQTEE